LNPNESKTFLLDVDSSIYRSQYKSKEVNLQVSSVLGDISKESKLKLNYLPCYEHEVIIYDYGNNKKNPLRTCANYDYSYNINVKNTGLGKDTYTLSLEGAPSTVKLSKYTTTLDAGSNDIIQLLMTGPEDNNNYNIKVKVTSSEGLSEYVDVWLKAYDTNSCHAVEFKKTNFDVNYQTGSITVPIKNIGLVGDTYLVSWNGSKIVNPTDVLVSMNTSGTEKISLSLNTYGLNESKYYGSIIVRDASGAKYVQDITLDLEDKSTIRKAVEYLLLGDTCKQFSLFEVFAIVSLIIIIIAFLIIGPHYPYNFKKRLRSKTSEAIFLIALLLIGLVAVLVFVGLPKTQTQVYNLTNNDSELTYEWLSDDKYVLDAGKFFYDPENSTLQYNVSGLTHIKPVIVGKTITFYSDLDWSGIEYATITASDSMGGKVTSPEFTLIVKNVPRKSTLELYNIYCWYANFAVYALILLLVFIAIFVKQQRRSRK
jgi:hypothetical protein